MSTQHKFRSRGRRGRQWGNSGLEQVNLIRRCLFEQLEDRRLLAALPTITIDDVQQVEGNSGTTDFVFTVTRSGKTNGSSTIDYSTAPGSATQDEDYEPVSGTLNFAPKETSKTIVVPVFGDTSVEDDEAFYVDLTIIDGGQFGISRGVGTIVSDETGPSLPELAIDDVQVVEGDSGTSNMVFTVTRTGDLSLPSTVDYATADGTATTDDGDYVETSGTLQFAINESSQTFAVPVMGDETVEDDETFFVDLTIVDNGLFGISRGVGTILNDDTEPVLPEVAINDMQMVEGNSDTTTMVFTVTRSGDLSGPSTVNYFTTDGTATTSDNDYVATSGTLSFAADEDSQTIAVDIVGDTSSEGSEAFYVDLSAPDSAVITVPRGTGLIVGDDGGLAPPPGLVSWWAADGTAADLMQRNDAVLIDGTTYAPGMVGQAFDFDGVDDRVQLPDSESLKLTESLSIEGWVMARAYPADRSMILFRGDDRGGFDPYSLQLLSSGYAMFQISTETNNTARLYTPMPLDQFVHLAGTLDDATGTMRLYIDGYLAAETLTDVRPFADLALDSHPGIGIGNHGGAPDTPHNFPFDGLIDELSVYNRALTSEEVQRIYHTGGQGKVKMTVAKTSPDIGSVVAVAPTEFVVDFTFPVNATSVQADDLQVNGIAADGVWLNDSDTATFSFSASPVMTQGLQSIYMPENGVVRAGDGLGLAEYLGEFRYDVTLLAVADTDPTAGNDLVLQELTASTTAILSMAGMDGGDGAWPVFYGTNPVSSSGLRVVVDEDTLSDTERSHTTEQLAFVAFDGTSSGDVAPYLRTGVVQGVTNSGWTEVILDHDYGSGMVVVATANYSASDPPLVARIKDAQGDRFWIAVQRADSSSTAVSGVDVHYVVMQEGVYANMEAVRFESTVTDGVGSWVGEDRTYQNTYTSPVVVGQVMSATEGEAFSVFWARGADSSSPPSSDALYVGKHVGDDPVPGRSSETIGYIVIEAGKRAVNELEYLAGVGSDTVVGMDEGPTIPLYQPNLATMQVHFNEPIDPNSVDTDDLRLSSGTVARAEATAADTAEYTLVGVAPMLTVEMTSLSVLDVHGNPMAPFSATYNPEDTKFYVVNSGVRQQQVFEYGASGASLGESWPVDSLIPAGAAANSAGTILWIVDWGGGGGGKVMVYDVDGSLTGSWTAKKSDSAEGIATDGTHIWVVNTNDNVVHRYSDAASRLSGNQFPDSSFDLAAESPTGITTDGNTLWVVDVTTDLVYLYTIAGELQGHWPLHIANTLPRGLTIDPSGASTSLWVVDADTDAVYEYDRGTGEFRGVYYLDTAGGNLLPSGIADPPPPTVGRTMAQSLVAPSVTEPSSTTSWLAGASYLPLVLSRRPFEPHLNTLCSEPVDEHVVPSDSERDTAWVNETWLWPLSPADVAERPGATKASAELCFREIAVEELDLLDDDLLSLIATGR